jgi:hypothetical protein
MVPIKDTSLIGRKIDCPKCKYRFVVEEPADSTDSEEAIEEAPARKRKGGRDEEVKATATKASARRRRSDEDDDDEEERGRPRAKPSGGGSNMLIIGGAIAAVCVVLVGVAAYFLMKDDEPAQASTSPPKAAPRDSAPAGGSSEGAPKEEKPAASSTAVAVKTGDVTVTNLLPNDTQQVVNLLVQDLLKSNVGRAVFDANGMLRPATFERKMGFSLEDIERLLLASNFSQNWTFNVVRTTKPLPVDNIKRTLQLKSPPDGPVNNKEYFLMESNDWLNNLSRQNPLANPTGAPAAPPGPTAVCFHDATTLVFADVPIMKQFLTTDWVKRSKPGTAAAPAESGTQQPGGGGSMSGPPGMALPGGRPGPGGPGGDPRGGMGGPGGVGGPPGMGGPGSVGGPPGSGGGQSAEGGEQSPNHFAYLTINPDMKAMLDRVEAKGVVLSMATDSNNAIKGHLRNAVQLLPAPDVPAASLLQNLAIEGFVKSIGDQANVLGACANLKDAMAVTAGIDFKSEETAKARRNEVQKALSQIAKALGEALMVKFDDPDQQSSQPGFGAPGVTIPGGQFQPPGGGMPPPPGGGGSMMPPRGAAGGRPGMGGDGAGDPRGSMGGPRGGQGPPGVGVPGAPPGMAMPGMPGGQQPGGGGQDQASEPGTQNSRLETSIVERTVLLMANITLGPKAYEELMTNTVRPLLLRRKGVMDMASGSPSRVHALAAALKLYTDQHKQFPRGTYPRDIPSTRNGRPYPPGDRISWLAELLPFLGQDDLFRRLDLKKSWRDPENLSVATTLVPDFLDAHSPLSSWWVRYPGARHEVADTQFVAIAGIGPDAAEYAADDQAVANKLGAFGYDRITKLSDIKDKPSETIVVVQVPPDFKRPWLAGGGSTVMGVPESRSIKPFVCVTHNGKRGTYAIMADCSVRFLPETTTDQAFKALCTIKGGEDVTLDRDTPIVPAPEGQPELRAVDTTPAPAAPKVVDVPQPSATGVKLDFKEFKSGSGGFTVLLPGYPQEARTTAQLPSGQATIRVYALESQGLAFAIRYTEMPTAPTGDNQIQQYLESMGADAAKETGGKLVGQRRIVFAGFPGTEYDIELPGGKGTLRTRGCIAKQRIYAVGVGPMEKISGPDLARYFDSFKLDVPAADAPAAPPEGAASQPPAGGNAQAPAALTTHCAQCHTGPRSKGKVQIFTAPGVLNPNLPKDKMLEVLRAGKMPPPQRPRPSQQDVAAIMNWLQGK